MTFTEILKETQFLLGYQNDTSFTQYKIEDMTRHSNLALDELTSIIMGVDGNWRHDDINHTDLPITETDIVSGQSQYTLDITHLDVYRIEVTAEDGSIIVLSDVVESDVKTSLEEYGNQTGTPTHYSKLGESLFLYPKPNYSSEKAMRIWVTRPASYFEVTDTDKKPGYAQIFHEFIPVWNAKKYASSQRDMNDTFNKMNVRLEEIKKAIKEYYAKRDTRTRLTVVVPNTM